MVTTMMVGPQGGTVTAGAGITLTVQPAALDQMTAVTVSVTSSAPPSDFAGATNVVEFEPSGIVFAKPVKITLPIAPGGRNPALYWTSHDGGSYERLGGTVENGKLTAEISHFSSGFTAATSTATRTVELTAIDTYILPTSIKNVPRDLSSTTVDIYVPTPSGYDVISGTGRADGTASITGVPDGEYFVKLGGSAQFLSRTGSQIDVGEIRTGYGHQLAALTTPLTFDVTNMQPWKDEDGLTFYSVLASAYYFLDTTDPDLVNAPAVDDTALSGFGFDSRFTAPFEPYLIKSGDAATMLHHVISSSSTNVPYLAAKEAYTTSTLAQTDGQSANVAGAFATSAGTTSTISVDYPGTQWDAYASQLYPAGSTVMLGAGRTTRYTFSVEAHPSGLEKCCLQTTLSLLTFGVDAGVDLASGVMSYLIPNDASYGQFGFASSAYRACRFAPGASARACVQIAMRRFDTLAAISATPIVPGISPVQNIRVDATALSTDITGAALTPLIEWDAPALGTATTYGVVLRVFPETGGSQIVAQFHLTQPHLRIPAGVMQAGNVYAVVITAYSNPNESPSSPQRITFPEFSASTLSYFFST
jgi:hypothetical protein